MKKIILILISTFAFAALMNSCGGKAEPATIEGFETYQNPGLKNEIKYPSNWHTTEQPTRFLAYSSKTDADRFIQYDEAGAPAAKIDFFIEMIDSTRTFEDFMDNAKIFDGSVYSTAVDVEVGGVTAKKQTYEFELGDGMFKGEVYYAMADSGVCNALFFEAFAGTFDALKPKFDEMLASVKWAKKPMKRSGDTLFMEEEADPPSETLRTVSGDGFSIQIPENFSKEGGFYIGQRRGDSYIRVDVEDLPENVNFDKTLENAKKSVNGSAPKEVTIGGVKGHMISYKPNANISGELYYVKKGSKMYRVTVNWFSGDPEEEKLFKPVLQKSAKTLKVN